MVKMVSVVVPTYNEQRYIGNCLRALQGQSLPREEYEIIVSDSSSTDRTVAIAKKLADRVVVCRKVSAGFGRNAGAKKAGGGIIAFVDADTIVSKNWLAAVKEAMGERGCVAATGPFKALERQSLVEVAYYVVWSNWIRLTTFFGKPQFAGFNFAVKKNAFDAVGGFKEEDIVTEDLDLAMRLKKRGKVRYNSRMLVRTSTRRLREIGVIHYAKHGILYTFFGKKYGWGEHRRDW